MRLLHFPTIGWLIVPERNTLSSVVLQYKILDNDNR